MSTLMKTKIRVHERIIQWVMRRLVLHNIVLGFREEESWLDVDIGEEQHDSGQTEPPETTSSQEQKSSTRETKAGKTQSNYLRDQMEATPSTHPTSFHDIRQILHRLAIWSGYVISLSVFGRSLVMCTQLVKIHVPSLRTLFKRMQVRLCGGAHLEQHFMPGKQGPQEF